jgi:DNA-binding NarL/FixJ family response regulator
VSGLLPALAVWAPILHAVDHSGPVMNEFAKPLQVYVVEDSPIIRRLLEASIQAAGAELIGSGAGAQTAVADLSELQPDLILIDISLDSGNGFDVLRALQERDLLPGAIKIVLTNHGNDEYRNLSLRLGANHFFDKSEISQVLALITVLAAGKGRSAGRSGTRDDSKYTNHNKR